MKIIGIDPGKTIGLCLYQDQKFVKGKEVVTVEEIIDFIQLNKPDQVVIEDFFISSRPSNYMKIPIEQIGVIKYFCKENRIPFVIQTPSALTFGRKRVKKIHKSAHVRSACCHVIYFIQRM